MLLLKGFGVLFLALGLYYVRFFFVRQEPITLVQLVTLLCAASWLLLYEGNSAARTVWFHGWWPVSWPAWATIGGALVLAAIVFVVMDRDSHSVSDTLNRIAPTYALLTALVLRLRAERAIPTNGLG
jgi:hypothetical protein